MPTDTPPRQQRVHLLVQLHEPIEPNERSQLSKDDITLLAPLNRQTWFAAVTVPGAEFMGRAERVRWADLFRPEDKIAEWLQQDREPLSHERRGEDRVAYSVLFHNDIDASEVIVLSREMNIQLEDFDADAFPVVRAVTVILPRSALMELASQDVVARIEPTLPPPVPDNRLNAQPLSNVDTVQAAPFNLDGTGVTVGLWEAGPAVVQPALLDLAPRLIVQGGQTAASSDHAAHVAGTIGASGVNVANAEGMAPNVGIASWDSAGDANEMNNAAVSPGGAGQPTPIQISNHSYGAPIGWNAAGTVFMPHQNQFGMYTNVSSNWDNIVSQTGLIVVKSAGNHRNDAPPAPVAGKPADCFQGGLGIAADCISPRGTAKNVITVGAVAGTTGPTTFSSFGPTDDGRIKPDLVAQGASVLSLACNCFDDQDLDGMDDVVPNTLTSSVVMGGTSMATPVVSGVSALVLQEAARLGIAMTPTAMKALLIQTAQDVQGVGRAKPGPDYATGWGTVDAEAAIRLLRQGGVLQNAIVSTGADNAWTSNFAVSSGQTEVHVTLVWDDPAGTPDGPALFNDLDLRLIDPNGTVFTPWMLNPAQPAVAAVENGGNDTVNNVEQVSAFKTTTSTPTPGTWTVQVSADSGNLRQAPQNFAVAGAIPLPDIFVDPFSLSFGTVAQGDVRDRVFNLVNNNAVSVQVIIERSPDPPPGQPISGFFWGGLDITLAPGESHSFLVSFGPRGEGPFQRRLQVTIVEDQVKEVELTGRGGPGPGGGGGGGNGPGGPTEPL